MIRLSCAKPGDTAEPFYGGRARCTIREADCRCRQRRLRNLSVPTSRSIKTASSTPFGLTVSGGDAPRESRPACGRGGLPPAASAQFVCTRSSGRIGRAMVSRGVDDPVTGPGANPNEVGSGVCRSATSEVEPQKSVAIDRGRRCCPSSACSSPDRAGVSRVRIRRRSSLLLRSGFGFASCPSDTTRSLTPPGTAWRRTAPASATGGRPPGPASLPGPTTPCACHASSPDAASTPWPWASSAASGTRPR